MAKRKRLTPARPDWLEAAPGGAPESKSMFPPGPAPIAQVAGEAAAASALAEVAGEMDRARAEGRLVQDLPLDAVEAGYLVRDRVSAEEPELAELIASIRARGQQTPIEVVALEPGRWGLISGWRRLTALRRLHAETGEARFATIRALLRRPESAAEAYLAMVEENEIRVGLSYYERARIAARAAETGVYPDARAAIRGLFAAASRAKRSKIGSFLTLYAALGDRLAFPAALPERLGLALVKALEADPALAPKLAERLRKAAPESAEAEQAVLARAVRAAGPTAPGGAGGRPAKPAATLDKPADAEEPVRGVYLQSGGGHLRPKLTLSGPRVDKDFRDRLVAWLKAQG